MDLLYNGESLRRLRISKGIELSFIARETRISKRYLEYIEDDNYTLLPGQAYLKGYLAQYAVFLGLDPLEVTESYLSCLNRGNPDTCEK